MHALNPAGLEMSQVHGNERAKLFGDVSEIAHLLPFDVCWLLIPITEWQSSSQTYRLAKWLLVTGVLCVSTSA